MIPRIIHYCWFGGKPLPESAEKCIRSWRRFCPDYELRLWNEDNYDVAKNAYMHEAYRAEKWGFVPDYARLDIVYRYGGVYLDTDVELLRPLDGFLTDSAFMGFESETLVNLGQGFGAEPGHPLIREMLESYGSLSFRNEDGSLNTTPSPDYQTAVLKKHGLGTNSEQFIAGAHIYPRDYFCPKDLETGKITLTGNTCSIHYFDASWMSPRQRFHTRLAQALGPELTKKLKKLLGRGK